MKKIILAIILTGSISLSFAEELSCQLTDGKTVVLRLNVQTVKYAYGLPDDWELVFSMSKNKIKFYRQNSDNSMILSLPYGNAYYEFGGDGEHQFLQVRNSKGKITFKEYCLD